MKKKSRRGGAKAGALHPARGRLRLAPPLTALWLLRRRSMSFALRSLPGCRLLSCLVTRRPSPVRLAARGPLACSPPPPRFPALPRLPPHARAYRGPARWCTPAQTEQRPRSGRCSAPPLRAHTAASAASAATAGAPPFPSPAGLAARPGECMAPIPTPSARGAVPAPPLRCVCTLLPPPPRCYRCRSPLPRCVS